MICAPPRMTASSTTPIFRIFSGFLYELVFITSINRLLSVELLHWLFQSGVYTTHYCGFLYGISEEFIGAAENPRRPPPLC